MVIDAPTKKGHSPKLCDASIEVAAPFAMDSTLNFIFLGFICGSKGLVPNSHNGHIIGGLSY